MRHAGPFAHDGPSVVAAVGGAGGADAEGRVAEVLRAVHAVVADERLVDAGVDVSDDLTFSLDEMTLHPYLSGNR